MLRFSLTILFIIFSTVSTANAQDNSAIEKAEGAVTNNAPLEKAKTPEDLRTFTVGIWERTRLTNQNQFHYIRQASEFRAYHNMCKRHALNVDMKPINALVIQYLQQILLAHYEEAEFAVLEAFPKDRQAALIEDFAGDLYAFEYSLHTALLNGAIEKEQSTTQSYCKKIDDDSFQKYVGLRATATRHFPAMRE